MKRTLYEINSEKWEKDEYGEFTEGPYDSQCIRVNTRKEAQVYIDDFKKEHPKAKKYNLCYDEEDLDMGIYEQKAICTLKAIIPDLDAPGGEIEIMFDVLKLVVDWD